MQCNINSFTSGMIVDAVTWRKIKLGSGKYTHFYCKTYFPLGIKNVIETRGNYIFEAIFMHTVMCNVTLQLCVYKILIDKCLN